MSAAKPFQIYHEVEDVGKRIRGSKKRAFWRFGFQGSPQKHELLVVHSILSGKKLAFLDGKQIHSSQSMKPLSFSTHLNDCMISAGATEDEPHFLRIDGVYFRDLPFENPSHSAPSYGPNAPKTRTPSMEAEHRHAHAAMEMLDTDEEFARRLAEEEGAQRHSLERQESEDERMARELQDAYDREHSDRQEHLRRTGASEAASPASPASPATRAELPGDQAAREWRERRAPAKEERAAPVDLLSFDDDGGAGAGGGAAAAAAAFSDAGDAFGAAPAGWGEGGGWDSFDAAAPAAVAAPPRRLSLKAPANMRPPPAGPAAAAPPPPPTSVSAAFSDMENLFLATGLEAGTVAAVSEPSPERKAKEKGASMSFDDIDPLAGLGGAGGVGGAG
ncbi:hypothetical protein TeGR_g3196, partial [Tetraparma gracilis]